jgi:hypothetical protein
MATKRGIHTMTLRLESELIERIDRARTDHAKLFKDYGSLIEWQHSFSRAAVIRAAIQAGLGVIEEKTKQLAREAKEGKGSR